MADLTYQNLLDSMRHVFVRNYLGKCLGPELVDSFNLRTAQSEYQYTLYYYDQAGNLVRTVPPKGVKPLATSTALDSVADYRDGLSGDPKYPDHDFVTRYWYNTLNKVVRDSTPDHGQSIFWYDRLGRRVLSQDSAQLLYLFVRHYTYYRYDALGRVIETGLTLGRAPSNRHPAIYGIMQNTKIGCLMGASLNWMKSFVPIMTTLYLPHIRHYLLTSVQRDRPICAIAWHPLLLQIIVLPIFIIH